MKKYDRGQYETAATFGRKTEKIYKYTTKEEQMKHFDKLKKMSTVSSLKLIK